jgi:hypothetical protein
MAMSGKVGGDVQEQRCLERWVLYKQKRMAMLRKVGGDVQHLRVYKLSVNGKCRQSHT